MYWGGAFVSCHKWTTPCRHAERAFKAAFPVQEVATSRKAAVAAVTTVAGEAATNSQQATIHLSDGYPVEEFR